MELREQRTICDILEAVRIQALCGILKKPLNHLHALNHSSLVHQVHFVLQAIFKVLLCHGSDSRRTVDYVILYTLVGSAIERKICTHNGAKYEALFFALHGIHHPRRRLCHCDKVRHHRRLVHQRYTGHPGALFANNSVVHRNTIYSHFLIHNFFILNIVQTSTVTPKTKSPESSPA